MSAGSPSDTNSIACERFTVKGFFDLSRSEPQRSFSGKARTEPVFVAAPEHAIGDGVKLGRGQEVAGSVPSAVASLVGGGVGGVETFSDAGAGFSERATGHGISWVPFYLIGSGLVCQ
tara:strand:- start:2590 stop:2943 length:354 start_codon:yes stop_codon:yes gene_type:complete